MSRKIHHFSVTLKTIVAFLACSLVLSESALTAEYDELQYKALLQQANSEGVAAVVVTLHSALNLTEMQSNASHKKAALSNEAEALLAELGESAWQTGVWNNNLGQVGMYVTGLGLETLAKSNLADKFAPDNTRKSRVRAYGGDGSLAAIERSIAKNGLVTVEVFLNVDAFEYLLGPFGETEVIRHFNDLPEQAANKIGQISQRNYARNLQDFDRQSQQISEKASINVTIDREAYYGLREDPAVRTIKPVGFKDPRKASWPQDVLNFAAEQSDTAVEVIVTLRGGPLFSPAGGYMSQTAWQQQRKANQRAFDDILGNISAKQAASSLAPEVGAVSARLTYNELVELYRQADPRILAISLNKPVAEPLLAQSTIVINMPSAWNAGFTAAGQNIIVIDSGVRRDHKFLQNSNGQSKVVFEACFGTTQGGYQSLCPSADSNGDSPLGLVGSAKPVSPCSNCRHGTHVAGIAAGKENLTYFPAGFQGVAPDADIIAINTYSYRLSNGVYSGGNFPVDMVAALQAVKDATVLPENRGFTVNMSIGGNLFLNSQTCDNHEPSLTSLVSNLHSRGIPVVASAGNQGLTNRERIGWPACVSKAVKVGGVVNDGNIIYASSNLGITSAFTGPILLAPARVKSSISDSSITTGVMDGTSFAAPHVAGLYAALKAAVPGISVDDATAWIENTGSVSLVNPWIENPGGTPVKRWNHTVTRIQIPNF